MKKRTYKVGQTITLPAIKSEGVPAEKAVVVSLPDKQHLMEVKTEGMGDDEAFEVAVSPRTGRVLSAIVGPPH